MTILERVLVQLGIRRTQRGFLLQLLRLWLVIPGRLNYANLARFSGKSEKTFRNWFRKPFNFLAVTSCLGILAQAQGHLGKTLALVIDSSPIDKSGKHTPGIGKYWHSKQGKAVSGLEVSCWALVDATGQYALPLDALQTPSTLAEGESRIDPYLHHLKEVSSKLSLGLCADIAYVVGDAYYPKKDFIDGVISTDKHYVVRG